MTLPRFPSLRASSVRRSLIAALLAVAALPAGAAATADGSGPIGGDPRQRNLDAVLEAGHQPAPPPQPDGWNPAVGQQRSLADHGPVVAPALGAKVGEPRPSAPEPVADAEAEPRRARVPLAEVDASAPEGASEFDRFVRQHRHALVAGLGLLLALGIVGTLAFQYWKKGSDQHLDQELQRRRQRRQRRSTR